MNNLDKQYTDLLQDILDNGTKKQTRNGEVISVFGRQIRHKMSEGFPLLTTKKMPFRLIATELLWFLRGDTNIKFLVDNDCHIWDGDAYKDYLDETQHEASYTKDEFINLIKTDTAWATAWGDLGPIYGAQWRNLNSTKSKQRFFDKPIPYDRFVDNRDGIDQIANLIRDLKTNPDSRRLMVNAWNVGELDQMVLPPCHFSFQCYSYENDGKRYLSLAWNQRSCDVGLGIPFNIASYGLLLEIIAKAVNMIPYELVGNLGDCHIYLNQIDGIKEQLNREPYPLPALKHMKTDEFYKSMSEDLSLLTHFDNTDFVVENYQSHPHIKLPLSN
jgi:thymidylate synthase